MAVAHATPEGPLKTYERFLGPIDRSEEGGRVLMGDDAAPRRAMGSRSGRAGGHFRRWTTPPFGVGVNRHRGRPITRH